MIPADLFLVLQHENPRIESTYDQILTAIVSSINKSQFNNTNEVAIFRMKGYISDVPFKFHLNFVQSKQDAVKRLHTISVMPEVR